MVKTLEEDIEKTALILLRESKESTEEIIKKARKFPESSQPLVGPFIKEVYGSFRDQCELLSKTYHSQKVLKEIEKADKNIRKLFTKVTGKEPKERAYRRLEDYTTATAFLLIGISIGFLIYFGRITTGKVVSETISLQSSSFIIPVFLFILGMIILVLKYKKNLFTTKK